MRLGPDNALVMESMQRSRVMSGGDGDGDGDVGSTEETES
jgi:hypothetical protein